MRSTVEAEQAETTAADPDARPMTEPEFQAAPTVPRTKTLRRARGLTQQFFGAHYRIPLGTLGDWQQGRATPDQTARASLQSHRWHSDVCLTGDRVAARREL